MLVCGFRRLKIIIIYHLNHLTLSSPPSTTIKLIKRITYFFVLFFVLLRRILNLVLLFELLDIFSELLPSLQDFFPFFLTRVYRPLLQCSHEPLSTFLLVYEELCHINFALPDQLGLFLIEFLAQPAGFL